MKVTRAVAFAFAGGLFAYFLGPWLTPGRVLGHATVRAAVFAGVGEATFEQWETKGRRGLGGCLVHGLALLRAGRLRRRAREEPHRDDVRH